MTRTIPFLALIVSALINQACTTPNGRTPIPLSGPGGTVVTCFQPPPDVATTSAKLTADAAIPKVVDVIKANVAVEQSIERIRTEIKDLQATEVLEFRLCVAYANGIMAKEDVDGALVGGASIDPVEFAAICRFRDHLQTS